MEVKCNNCGKMFIYKGGSVHFSRSKNHYCSNECLGKHNIVHGLASKDAKGKQDKRYSIWCNAKRRAKLNDVYFDLKIEDIPEIPEYCPVLGIKICANDNFSPLDSSPSLDRINTNIGYQKDNIRIISNRANRIKSDATLEELILITEDLKQYA